MSNLISITLRIPQDYTQRTLNFIKMVRTFGIGLKSAKRDIVVPFIENNNPAPFAEWPEVLTITLVVTPEQLAGFMAKKFASDGAYFDLNDVGIIAIDYFKPETDFRLDLME